MDEMTAELPSDRLTMRDVVARFDEIQPSLPWWTLRRPIDNSLFPTLMRIVRMAPTIARALRAMWCETTAVPIPL